MAKQFAHGHVFPARGRLGEVLRERIIEADFTRLDQHHDGGRRELLAHRSRLKDRLRLYRHLQFDVGKSEPFGADDLAVSGDQQSETRDVLTLHLAFDILTDIAVDRALSDQSGAYKEGTGQQPGAGSGKSHGSLRRRPRGPESTDAGPFAATVRRQVNFSDLR